MTTGTVHSFLADDHARLDVLLLRAAADPENIDQDAYAQFRSGLLRHIAMEEKVLLPHARRRRNGEALPVVKQLREDHSALAALLVPVPTYAIIKTIRDILESHNKLEEGPAGVYAMCEELAGAEVDSLLLRIKAVPQVRVAPHFDNPRVHEHIARLLKSRQG